MPGHADERVGALQRSLAPSYASPALVAPGGQSMTNYARMYRFGITPWERYGTVAAASITALLDREETERSRPLGRLRGLGDARGRAGGHSGPGLADEQDRAAVVQAAPADLERHCPASRYQSASGCRGRRAQRLSGTSACQTWPSAFRQIPSVAVGLPSAPHRPARRLRRTCRGSAPALPRTPRTR